MSITQPLAKPPTASTLIPIIRRLGAAFDRPVAPQDVVAIWLPLLEGIPQPCIEKAAESLLAQERVFFTPHALVSRAHESWVAAMQIAGTTPPAPPVMGTPLTESEWAQAWAEVAAYGPYPELMHGPALEAALMKRMAAAARATTNDLFI